KLDAYRIEADVCQWASGFYTGQVGVYFGRKTTETVHLFWTVTFNDIEERARLHPEANLQGNLARLELQLMDRGLIHNLRGADPAAIVFEPAKVEKKIWR